MYDVPFTNQVVGLFEAAGVPPQAVQLWFRACVVASVWLAMLIRSEPRCTMWPLQTWSLEKPTAAQAKQAYLAASDWVEKPWCSVGPTGQRTTGVCGFGSPQSSPNLSAVDKLVGRFSTHCFENVRTFLAHISCRLSSAGATRRCDLRRSEPTEQRYGFKAACMRPTAWETRVARWAPFEAMQVLNEVAEEPPEEPRSRMALFQGWCHGCETGPDLPILRLSTPGSGIYFDLGKTIAFDHHVDMVPKFLDGQRRPLRVRRGGRRGDALRYTAGWGGAKACACSNEQTCANCAVVRKRDWSALNVVMSLGRGEERAAGEAAGRRRAERIRGVSTA